MSIRTILLAAASVALFSQCSSLSTLDYSPPEVWVNSLLPQDMTLMSTSFSGNLRIENEDIEPITLVGAVHKFYVNGKFLGKGMNNQALTIPGLSTANQDVPITASNLRFAAGWRDLVGTGNSYSYALKSTLYISRNGGRAKRVSVTNEGTIDVAGQQQAPRR